MYTTVTFAICDLEGPPDPSVLAPPPQCYGENGAPGGVET